MSARFDLAIKFLVLLAMMSVVAYTGYEVGKGSPCVDEESFEIHPMN
jgi:hypothetical protein